MPNTFKLRKRFIASRFLVVASLFIAAFCSSCSSDEPSDATLLRNTYCELVDWHITGLWVINCPVAWVRVANYNSRPIKDVKLKYTTYDFQGTPLDTGTYALEGDVAPGSVKNFIEQYLGLVSLHSEKLSIQVIGVSQGP
jgi:hypothetical protein